MKKILSVVLAAMLLLSFCACSNGGDAPKTSPSPTAEEYTGIDIKVGALKGPTGMGISKLAQDAKENKTANNYSIELFSAPTDITGLIVNGELDIAAVPTNLASTLYNKTNGGVQLLALNTLGVLYVMEKGDTIHSLSDLDGKKIYSSGKASTPEYALNYVLKQNNISCEVEYFATHAELMTQALAGAADIILIPEPNVSTILAKNAGFRIALDFNKEWDKACNNSAYFSMGCLVVRSEFAKNNKAAVDKFLEEYTASVNYVNNNVQASAEIIAQMEIVPSAAIAASAIPNCNIVAISGTEMKEKTQPFLQILFESDATAIGGKMPGEDFYY